MPSRRTVSILAREETVGVVFVEVVALLFRSDRDRDRDRDRKSFDGGDAGLGSVGDGVVLSGLLRKLAPALTTQEEVDKRRRGVGIRRRKR